MGTIDEVTATGNTWDIAVQPSSDNNTNRVASTVNIVNAIELPSIIEIASIDMDKLQAAIERWKQVLQVIVDERDKYYTVTWKTGRDSMRKVFSLKASAEEFKRSLEMNANNREVQLIATLKSTGWDRILDLMGYKPRSIHGELSVEFQEVGSMLVRTEKSGAFELEEWYSITGDTVLRMIAHVFYENTRTGRTYTGVGEVNASERKFAHGGHDMRLLALTRATRALAARAIPTASALLGIDSIEAVENYEEPDTAQTSVSVVSGAGTAEKPTMNDFLAMAANLGVEASEALNLVSPILQQEGPNWSKAMLVLKGAANGITEDSDNSSADSGG